MAQSLASDSMHSQGKLPPTLTPTGRFAGKPTFPISRSVTVIGARKNARIRLMSKSVSQNHAIIVNADSGPYIRDLASREHVLVNGLEVREGPLSDGDEIQIGHFTFRFNESARTTPSAVVRNIQPAPHGELEVESEPMPVPVEGKSMLIGRRETCDLALIEESASTCHAILFEMDGRRYLRDLGSRTGTFVNGTPIKQVELKPGDEVRIGETTMRYSAELSPATESFAPTSGRSVSAPVGLSIPLEPAHAAEFIPIDESPEPSDLQPPLHLEMPSAPAGTDELELSHDHPPAVEPVDLGPAELEAPSEEVESPVAPAPGGTNDDFLADLETLATAPSPLPRNKTDVDSSVEPPTTMTPHAPVSEPPFDEQITLEHGAELHPAPLARNALPPGTSHLDLPPLGPDDLSPSHEEFQAVDEALGLSSEPPIEARIESPADAEPAAPAAPLELTDEPELESHLPPQPEPEQVTPVRSIVDKAEDDAFAVRVEPEPSQDVEPTPDAEFAPEAELTPEAEAAPEAAPIEGFKFETPDVAAIEERIGISPTLGQDQEESPVIFGQSKGPASSEAPMPVDEITVDRAADENRPEGDEVEIFAPTIPEPESALPLERSSAQEMPDLPLTETTAPSDTGFVRAVSDFADGNAGALVEDTTPAPTEAPTDERPDELGLELIEDLSSAARDSTTTEPAVEPAARDDTAEPKLELEPTEASPPSAPAQPIGTPADARFDWGPNQEHFLGGMPLKLGPGSRSSPARPPPAADAGAAAASAGAAAPPAAPSGAPSRPRPAQVPPRPIRRSPARGSPFADGRRNTIDAADNGQRVRTAFDGLAFAPGAPRQPDVFGQGQKLSGLTAGFDPSLIHDVFGGAATRVGLMTPAGAAPGGGAASTDSSAQRVGSSQAPGDPWSAQTEQTPETAPTQRPSARHVPPAMPEPPQTVKKRRWFGLFALTLLAILGCAGAKWGIDRFVPDRSSVIGQLHFANIDSLTLEKRKELGSQQLALLSQSDLRQEARTKLVSMAGAGPGGFLDNPTPWSDAVASAAFDADQCVLTLTAAGGSGSVAQRGMLAMLLTIYARNQGRVADYHSMKDQAAAVAAARDASQKLVGDLQREIDQLASVAQNQPATADKQRLEDEVKHLESAYEQSVATVTRLSADHQNTTAATKARDSASDALRLAQQHLAALNAHLDSSRAAGEQRDTLLARQEDAKRNFKQQADTYEMDNQLVQAMAYPLEPTAADIKPQRVFDPRPTYVLVACAGIVAACVAAGLIVMLSGRRQPPSILSPDLPDFAVAPIPASLVPAQTDDAGIDPVSPAPDRAGKTPVHI